MEHIKIGITETEAYYDSLFPELDISPAKSDVIYDTLNGKEYYWFFGKRRWKFHVEEEQKKEYIKNVIELLMNKYNMGRKQAKRIYKKSYLKENFKYNIEETLHEDIETNVDQIYFDYLQQHRKS